MVERFGRMREAIARIETTHVERSFQPVPYHNCRTKNDSTLESAKGTRLIVLSIFCMVSSRDLLSGSFTMGRNHGSLYGAWKEVATPSLSLAFSHSHHDTNVIKRQMGFQLPKDLYYSINAVTSPYQTIEKSSACFHILKQESMVLASCA